ncbi:MAG: hypothetical protein ACYCOU_03720 [Sulfobacillus sp.]
MTLLSAPHKIEKSEMEAVKTVYGDTLYVFRPQLAESRNVYLKLYRKSGLSVFAHNERMHISPSWQGAYLHRENIA